MAPFDYLDAEELLYLAIRAGNTPDTAIVYLKRALQLAPDDARLHYCLGGQYAGIGLTERAARSMERALELDPELASARFQLGMLHMTAGDTQRATGTWAALDALGDGNCFFHFKTGLSHLMRDEFDDGARHLRQGIALNNISTSLNRDMESVLEQIEAQRGGVQSGPAGLAQPAADTAGDPGHPGHHFLLGAYSNPAG